MDLWWFTADHSDKGRSWPWPMWVMIFWGLAILLEYFNAYGPGDKEKMANDEYEKLKRNQ